MFYRICPGCLKAVSHDKKTEKAVSRSYLERLFVPRTFLHYNRQPHFHPHPNTCQIPSYLHQLFYPNSQVLFYFVKTHLQPTPEDLSFLKSITASCKICQISDSNSRYHSVPFPTHQARGSLPGTDWQLDFTHMPAVKRAKYLLVLVDTFSGWVEAFPTINKRAQTVSDLLPPEIIP